jgi:hypothetical protein
MTIRPLTAEDAGKRVRIPFPDRAYEGVMVWDGADEEAPIGLSVIPGSALAADAWFKAGTEGEVLE